MGRYVLAAVDYRTAMQAPVEHGYFIDEDAIRGLYLSNVHLGRFEETVAPLLALVARLNRLATERSRLDGIIGPLSLALNRCAASRASPRRCSLTSP